MSLPDFRVLAPACQASGFESPLHANNELCTTAGESTAKELGESFTVPIHSGRACTAPKGHDYRLTTPYAARAGDLNIWNPGNRPDRFWASRTRQLHCSHVTKLDRLWSCLPYMTPLVTITGDSHSGYRVDESPRSAQWQRTIHQCTINEVSTLLEPRLKPKYNIYHSKTSLFLIIRQTCSLIDNINFLLKFLPIMSKGKHLHIYSFIDLSVYLLSIYLLLIYLSMYLSIC